MWIYYFLFLLSFFFLGAALASFLALLHYRLPKKENWTTKPSFCDHCRQKISLWSKVPVFSYLFLRGKCRFCQKKIPPLYFWWELINGLFFSWWAGQFLLFSVDWWTAVPLLFLGQILIFVALIDWQRRYITSFWLGVIALLTIFTNIIWFLVGKQDWPLLGQKLLASLTLLFLFFLIDFLGQKIWRQEVTLGQGDAFLIALLAWWLDPRQSLTMLLFSFWSGALLGLFLLWRKKSQQKGDGKLAFIPFIVIGFYGSYAFAEQLWRFLENFA